MLSRKLKLGAHVKPHVMRLNLKKKDGSGLMQETSPNRKSSRRNANDPAGTASIGPDQRHDNCVPFQAGSLRCAPMMEL